MEGWFKAWLERRTGAVVHQPCLGQKDETSPKIRIETSGGMCYHKHVFT